MSDQAKALGSKIALITGAAGGIGQAAALLFAAQGARVAAVDLNPLDQTVDLIEAAGGEVMAFQADVTDAANVEKLLAEIVEHYGALDSVFNVVGGSGRRMGDAPIADCTLEGWDYTLNLNLTSVFLVCKYAIPHLLARGGGAIINLASVLGMVGHAEFATHAYAASKGAIISLSRAMAVYYAPQGVRVNVIAPGLIETPMSQRAQANPAIMALMAQLQPITGAMGQAEDVAAAAAFLASDAAHFITGVVLPVDGGWTAQ